MTREVRICVCRRPAAAVLLLGIFSLAPQSIEAAPILTGVGGSACEPASPSCQLFAIDPVSASLTGSFAFDNDVALFQFLLGPGSFTFSASTSSALMNFDPILTLFGPLGAPVTYTTAEGEFRAEAFGLAQDTDAALPVLTLAGGATYTLALTQFGPNIGNFSVGALQDGFGQDAFPCFTFDPFGDEPCSAGDSRMFGEQSGSFSLDLTFTPADTAAVPEPGTLSLLALGSIGAGLMRARRARRRATRP